ncbi:hypothetical protein L6164_022506 [Bauhinia variegata]|uniref:Uncharacterized protein n=1 Tax=Bauhinia variegata TaxID=167791 RepID=A0ACB9MFV6_BAUVA|nr:hypothetical protein L6164_022506 [Bauhinia variegata]
MGLKTSPGRHGSSLPRTPPYPKPYFIDPPPRSDVSLALQTQYPLSGRYLSKRQRELLVPVPFTSSFTVSGSIADTGLPHGILSLLRNKAKAKGHLIRNRVPEKLSVALHGHAKAVNAIHWSSTHGSTVQSGKDRLFPKYRVDFFKYDNINAKKKRLNKYKRYESHEVSGFQLSAISAWMGRCLHLAPQMVPFVCTIKSHPSLLGELRPMIKHA